MFCSLLYDCIRPSLLTNVLQHSAQTLVDEQIKRLLPSVKQACQSPASSVSTAERCGGNVQVMAKHRQGAIRAFFIGSATKFVANHCKQPVVVLH